MKYTKDGPIKATCCVLSRGLRVHGTMAVFDVSDSSGLPSREINSVTGVKSNRLRLLGGIATNRAGSNSRNTHWVRIGAQSLEGSSGSRLVKSRRCWDELRFPSGADYVAESISGLPEVYLGR